MTRFSQNRHLFKSSLCVFLVLVCAFSLILPHIHECEGAQCDFCELLRTQRLLIPRVSTVFAVVAIVVALLGIVLEMVQGYGGSLVSLKVKLSD